jgi:hypothetical protein
MWTYYIIIKTIQNRTAGDVNTLHWKTLTWPIIKDIIVRYIGNEALAGVTEEIEAGWLSSGDECLHPKNNNNNNNNNNNKSNSNDGKNEANL